MSRKLTPATATSTSTSPAPGSGAGTSRSSSTSGPPNAVRTIARTARAYRENAALSGRSEIVQVAVEDLPVLPDDLFDDVLDLALGTSLADELLDQHQILGTHTSEKVAAVSVSSGHRSGDQVDKALGCRAV